MATFVLLLVCLSLLFGTSLSCYQCLVDLTDSYRLCWGYKLTKYNVRSVDSCFRTLDRIFNNNERVIEAGRVGKGYDKQLRDILNAQILPLAQEFDGRVNYETVYEERLQKAAGNFIAAASKLPRACYINAALQRLWRIKKQTDGTVSYVIKTKFSNLRPFFPQFPDVFLHVIRGAVYNCITCKYHSCEFPLDCPFKEIKAKESSRSQMWCNVSFQLPDDIEMIWRFAEEVKTQQVDQFKEVTAGLDRFYSIRSTSLQHQGTYQCEIYSGRRSIVRVYYYLNVTPQTVVEHSQLQEIFDQSILSGDRLVPVPDDPPHTFLPPTLLLTACFTAVFLLFFLFLGTLFCAMNPDTTHHQADPQNDL